MHTDSCLIYSKALARKRSEKKRSGFELALFTGSAVATASGKEGEKKRSGFELALFTGSAVATVSGKEGEKKRSGFELALFIGGSAELALKNFSIFTIALFTNL